MSKTVRIAWAFLAGLFSLPLLFLLAEGIKIPLNIPAAALIHRAVFIICMGAYFIVAGYLLACRVPGGVLKNWPHLLALNLTLVVAAANALAVEPNKSAAMEAAGIALFAVASSIAGAAVGAQAARRTLL